MVKRVGDKGEEVAGEGNAITTGSPLLLAMVILLHAVNHFIGGALPVLYPAIMEEFDLGYVQLGFLRSASSFSAGFPQMFVGALRRRFSGRTLIGLGNLVYSVLNMAAGYVGSFQQFIALRVVAGIGGSPQHPIGTSMLTTNTHPSWRGRVFGINLAAPTLASTLAPLLAAWLLLSLGWRATLTVLSVPALLASLVMLFVVKENADADARSRSFSMRGLIDALRNRNVLAISALRTVMAFRMGVRAFIPLYFINVLGMATGLSSTLYSVMIFGGVVGPFFWGYLADRMPRKPIIIAVLGAQGVLFYSLQIVTDVVLLAPLLFLIGFMAQTVVMQSVLADSTEEDHLDQVFGFYYTLGFTLGSISSVIFAYIVEALGFNYGFTYIAAVTAISIIPAFFIQEPKVAN
jgi:FSR family fosmidomycin resistance protein-like MFS transporter